MNEARRLSDYIIARNGGKNDILYGISYGCRVLKAGKTRIIT